MLHASQMAEKHTWRSQRILTSAMPLQAWFSPGPEAVDALTIYIEGDGLSWISSDHTSDDPTPIEPLALQLALNDPSSRAIYLARPCQFLSAADLAAMCTPADWREGRFSQRLIDVMSEALDQIKQTHRAKALVLVGYSGGGAMATLLAARREDVFKLITIAGNLNHRDWALHHRLTPLHRSKSPMEEVNALAGVNQLHLVGEHDRNVTPEMTYAFAQQFPKGRQPVVMVVRGFDHRCCWSEQWGVLWQRLILNKTEFSPVDRLWRRPSSTATYAEASFAQAS